MTFLRHVLAIAIIGFFIASFFVGMTIDPSYVEIARSPYGLFTYVIVTLAAAFIPALATVPIVITATIIWGPWVAGLIALIGWTLGGFIQYAAGYFAVNTIFKWTPSTLERKIEKVSRAVKFWQVLVARLVIPSFIFGVVRTKFSHFAYASLIDYVPLVALGTASGELLRPYYEEIQPLITGAAFIVLILTIDYFFVRKEQRSPKQKTG
jgi:uncharacterized membrane protein YdjX (TVP38/TMEM64 family)